MNNEFKIALEKVLRDVCGRLSGKEVPTKLWTRIVPEGGGRTSFPEESRSDFVSISSKVHKILESLDSFDKLLDFVAGNEFLKKGLLRDAGDNPIGERAAQKNWLNRHIVTIIVKHCEKAGGLSFESGIYESLYGDLVAELESDETRVRVVSLLMNLEISSPEVILNESLRLRQVPPSELERWLNPAHFFMDRPLPLFELLNISCAIELQFKRPTRSSFGEYNREPTKQLLSAVRLVSNHDVHVALTQEENIGMLTLGSSYSVGDIRRFSGQFKFNPESEAQLKRIFEKLTASASLEHIKLALSRWDSATEKQNSHDKLIDYWIAFESLFTPGSSAELKYRACFRIAAFMGNSAEERVEIYRVMRKSYDIRSAYVHSAKTHRNDDEIIQKTRSFLRASLIKIIEDPALFKPENMEEEILSTFRSEPIAQST